MSLLEVKNLNITFDSARGITHAVKGASFSVEEGEILGIVGESGSGKTATSLAVMGLLPGTASYSGEVLFEGRNFAGMSFEELRQFKGSEVAMIFQEPMSSLNPLVRVGRQVEEMLTLCAAKSGEKGKLTKARRREKVLEMFRKVELPEPEVTYKKYPHELSGGQQQRVMIAMALVCGPKLLIADEPTTALDADVAEEIIALLKKMNKETGTAVIFVSHDLSVIRKLCRRILVMYHGKIVERGTAEEIFGSPKDPYTKKLVAAVSGKRKTVIPNDNEAVLKVRNLTAYYLIKSERLGAGPEKKIVTKDLSFDVKRGEILGLVGDSGSGKTTACMSVLGLHREYEGEIVLKDKNPQMIFQNSAACLNPARKIEWILEEPLKNMTKLSRSERKAKVREMLSKVEMGSEYLKAYPHQLSGGQKQRINIALALMSNPEFVIADEPVSALDVTIQEQILKLLMSLQKEFNLSMLFISHDINVINRICDRVVYLDQSE